MAIDLQRYWGAVREVQSKLPQQDIYYLVSLDTGDRDQVAGRVMDIASSKEAAKLIVGRTHALATAEQIEEFHKQQKMHADDLAAIELKRKGHLAMPQELQDLVRLAVEGVNKPKKGN